MIFKIYLIMCILIYILHLGVIQKFRTNKEYIAEHLNIDIGSKINKRSDRLRWSIKLTILLIAPVIHIFVMIFMIYLLFVDIEALVNLLNNRYSEGDSNE
ncbi:MULTISPECIES: hypothetical protein [unclassified Clostridium]|uniref:hypothetical protein n=1 Tax=unclassified Clostridium TaxID=2614128 RepID=UPI0025C19F9C|nr:MULTISPECIES: hypothetical protein [unclassified Clostridium]